jgi:hypothetical protein
MDENIMTIIPIKSINFDFILFMFHLKLKITNGVNIHSTFPGLAKMMTQQLPAKNNYA